MTRWQALFDRIIGRENPPAPVEETEPEIAASHPNGHFYSPVVDPAELRNAAHRIWPDDVPDALGIDFNDAYHAHVLDDLFPQFYSGFDYAELGPADEALNAFYIQNSQFSWLDARSLFVLLRAWQPRRIIEVGSGFSTLLMTDVARRFLPNPTSITAIEPYPRPFLKHLDIELREEKVQDVPLEAFDTLQAGDVLFIDSSHVAKTGSDVNRLFFEVLPRLAPGVRIHVHDIFLPHDYPQEWVLAENRSWNEQYLLRALLMFSTRFRILFGSAYAQLRHRNSLARALDVSLDKTFGGGSLWLEVREIPPCR